MPDNSSDNENVERTLPPPPHDTFSDLPSDTNLVMSSDSDSKEEDPDEDMDDTSIETDAPTSEAPIPPVVPNFEPVPDHVDRSPSDRADYLIIDGSRASLVLDSLPISNQEYVELVSEQNRLLDQSVEYRACLDRVIGEAYRREVVIEAEWEACISTIEEMAWQYLHEGPSCSDALEETRRVTSVVI